MEITSSRGKALLSEPCGCSCLCWCSCDCYGPCTLEYSSAHVWAETESSDGMTACWEDNDLNEVV